MDTLAPEFVAGVRLEGDTIVLNLPFPADSQYGMAFMIHEAYLAFFDGQRIDSRYAWKRWINTLVGYFTHGFTHTEMCFRLVSTDLQHEAWLACNIYQVSCCYIIPRAKCCNSSSKLVHTTTLTRILVCGRSTR